MAITAQSADGVLHQFPDGTAPTVIDKAMQDYTTSIQPSVMQQIMASPPGRLVHDFAAPIGGLASSELQTMANGSAPNSPARKLSALAKSAGDSIEGTYQDALSAARNTPGYAAARQAADSAQALKGSGASDQILGPIAPAAAGTFGGLIGGSRIGDADASNAAADAQQSAQNAYASQHPLVSRLARLASGFMAGPEGAAQAAAAPTAALSKPVLAAGVLPKVATKAADYVGGLMASAKTDPVALAAFDTGGKPFMAADAIGKPGQVGLGALARRPGATPDAVQGALTARDAAAPDRILGDYASAAGIDPNAAKGNLDAFVDANQNKADPLYKQAYAANQNISSPTIDRILATPAGKKAMSAASDMMQDDQSLMGVADPDLLEQAREAGQDIPWKGGVASGLKLRSLDYVKRALGDQISEAYRAGANTKGGILTGLKNRLTSALDDADVTAQAGPNSTKPEGGLYAQARGAAGDYLGAKEQFANGQDFILNNNVTADDLKSHLDGLGASDAQAFKGGVANRLFNVAQNGKMGPQVFKAPIIQQKLAAVMGGEPAASFLANVQKEADIAGNSRFMKPSNGSPTATFNAAMAEQDGAPGVHTLALDAAQNVANSGLPGGLVKTALQYSVHKPLAVMRTRGMSIPVRDEAGRLLTMPPKDLAAYLQQPGLMSKQAALPQFTLPTPAARIGLFGGGVRALMPGQQQQNQ